MQVEIKHIHENLGITMVFVTHDQDEALTMSDRIAILNDGRIQQVDDPTVIYERPVNEFVATFVGETNMLAATVEDVDASGLAVLRLDGGDVVRASATGTLRKGGKAVLSVRPERLNLDAANSGRNALSATLVETIYHGASIKMIFHLTSGHEITPGCVPGIHWRPCRRGRGRVCHSRPATPLFSLPSRKSGNRSCENKISLARSLSFP